MKNPLSSFSALVNIILFTVFLSIIDLIVSIISKSYFMINYFLNTYRGLNSSTEVDISTSFQILLFMDILLSFYLLWLLFQFGKLFYNSKAISFFSNKNGKVFQTIGIGMISYTILILPIKIFQSFYKKNQEFGELINYSLERNIMDVISNHYYLLIVAIFILVISHLIKDGRLLKKENDLTI